MWKTRSRIRSYEAFLDLVDYEAGSSMNLLKHS
jgi:hypothetical protein